MKKKKKQLETTTTTCPVCLGIGSTIDSGMEIQCSKCEGSGEVIKNGQNPKDNKRSVG